MVLLTVIARLQDGLPLAASMSEDEQTSRWLNDYQQQAKQICRRLNSASVSRSTVESGAMHFHYLIETGVIYLVLTEKQFSRRLAFLYLEELKNEFESLYAPRVNTVSRPYAFIEFDNFIQRCKKSYTDSRATANLANTSATVSSSDGAMSQQSTSRRQNAGLNKVSSELADVQRIVVQNINDILQRGEAMSALDAKAVDLAAVSVRYRDDARKLNQRSTFMKLLGIILLIVLVILAVNFLIF